jgi:outer membrane protein assembly factor BamD (BamD/ComL family)
MGEEALKARLVEELRELVKRYPANRFYREALARIEVLEKALEPFTRGPDGTSLAKLYAHLTREHYRAARAALQGVSDHG